VSVLIVLDDDRDAVQRAHETVVRKRHIEAACALAGVPVHGEDRVQIVVVRVDAGQIAIDE